MQKPTFDVRYHIHFALGYAGQYILVVPELAMTAVISSHMPRKGLVPLKQFVEYLNTI
ncbi:hypothetical protein MUG87_02430 [Ectobacillus sp. JY-23]|uniref:hypothetical protein n=1 Tax=Ectobacillus sp. JY-23 TaxID=2933872 RepID=UPI001FF3A63B|nr:hypothetical protein [Ectobacillus sp. JY-23]UOY93015.1 hypothetical protein MUG87_02430 [Ectobacillus sp. JY-23]